MKNLVTTFMLLTALSFSGISPLFSQNFQELYQKALIKEEGEGALLEAIDIYNQIVEDKNAEPLLQAKALIHVGYCYEKLGMTEATKAYQRLVKNFPGQKSEVTIARERLSHLIQIAEEITKEPEGIVIKQIWKGSEVDNSGSVSQDGKYLSFVNWDTGDLAIRNLNTKQNSSLVSGSWDTPMQYAQYNVISPDGKQIAYSWYNHNASDLYLINIDNPFPKLLYRKRGVEVYPVSWLSDKEIIVTIKNKGADAQIASYSILDGTIEVLKTFDQRKWARLTSSPDENYIAYDFANESHDGTFDINILSMNGKGEIALVEHPANDRVLGWMPERNEFLFISDRSGTWDLWAIAVDNGKPLGQERRIYTDIGAVEPMGITKNGECFYGFSNRNFNSYILPVNKLTGKPEGNPEILLAGSIYSKNWSPDGKYMARVQEGEGGFELIIRDEENGNERRLAEELFYILGPYWSRDRQSVYIFGMDKKRLRTKGYKGGIFTVDLKSNKLKENLLISDYNYTPSKDAAPPISGHVVSDDQQYIYMLFQNDWIVKHNLNNGKDTILYRHPKFVRGVFRLSPDGNKLLFAIQNKGEKLSRLLTISTQGGDEKELCTSQESNISGSAFWSPDGKYVYFSERPEGTNLWRVDANGGTPEKVWKTDKVAESFIMHPSGEKISYSVRERITEVRVIEGLVNELEKIFSKNQ